MFLWIGSPNLIRSLLQYVQDLIIYQYCTMGNTATFDIVKQAMLTLSGSRSTRCAESIRKLDVYQHATHQGAYQNNRSCGAGEI